MRKLFLTSGLVGTLITAAVSIAQAEVVLTGSQLDNAALYSLGSACTSGCSAGYNGTNAVITTSDGSSFSNTATITIQNGYNGVALGTTLSDLLAQGALGNVSFNLVSATNNVDGNGNANYMAYWNVELTNPTNSSDTVIVNAFGDNILNGNPFNQGSSQNASCDSAGNCYFNLWSTTPYSSWLIDAVTISVGGWNSGESHTDVISEIDLPGTPSETPIPAAVWLFGSVLAGSAGLTRRRNRKIASVLAT